VESGLVGLVVGELLQPCSALGHPPSHRCPYLTAVTVGQGGGHLDRDGAPDLVHGLVPHSPRCWRTSPWSLRRKGRAVQLGTVGLEVTGGTADKTCEFMRHLNLDSRARVTVGCPCKHL
jgi:hypothetical protein